MQTVSVSSTVKKYPVWPYQKIKDEILGTRYQLTLTFIGTARAARLNKTYRDKDYTPNVLSFPLDEQVGEIYICPEIANKEAYQFELSPRGYIAFLFIHGCLHLKGLPHGDTMDRLERKYVHKFNIK